MCSMIGAGGGGNIQCIVLKIKYRRGLHIFFSLHSPIARVEINAYLKQAV